jgi:Zn-dependent peptidase ImmA (M78 family)
MSRRSKEIVRATAEAAMIQSRFPTGNRSSFDIIGAVLELEIPLLFRPLKGLWGAAIAIEGGERGIMVTTQLDLHVQRFTLAHELGHILLGHRLSLDETVGFAGRNSPISLTVQEVAANTFASELLGAKAIILDSARRHHWTKAALHDPANIYQLSLRLGMSYQATCWSLVVAGVLLDNEASRLQAESVKTQKRTLAPSEMIVDSWADVWAITEADSGLFIEAGPNDLFAIRVQDNSSAGYLWRLVDIDEAAMIVSEGVASLDGGYGALTTRIVYLRFTSAGVHRLLFEHARPWNGATLGHIDISIDGHGKEVGGFPRRARRQALRLV